MSEESGSTSYFRFDNYTLVARITPAFLVFLPLSISIGLCFPDISIFKRLSGALLIPFSISMLLGQIGRDMGRMKQAALWKSWGGPPTTQYLRHKDTTFNPVLRKKCHRRLEVLLPEINIPTPDEENSNPKGADNVYSACTSFLISRTRDHKKFPLVYKENVNYGFRRNAWAMKPFAIILSITGIAICGFFIWFNRRHSGVFSTDLIVAVLLNLLILMFWVFWINPGWVRIPANAYAERLLEACDQLEEER